MSEQAVPVPKGQMTIEMAKTLIKQKAFELVKNFTDRMKAEKIKSEELRFHAANDDGGGLLIGAIVEELKERGCTIDGMYGYPIMPAPNGQNIFREMCIVCTNTQDRRIII